MELAPLSRQRYLERAIELYDLSKNEDYYEPFEHVLVARALWERDTPDKTVKAYQRALALAPRQIDWRYELATVLYEQGNIADARRELHFVLGRDPAHAEAQGLMENIYQELALDFEGDGP